jgi:hypothetical protein
MAWTPVALRKHRTVQNVPRMANEGEPLALRVRLGVLPRLKRLVSGAMGLAGIQLLRRQGDNL